MSPEPLNAELVNGYFVIRLNAPTPGHPCMLAAAGILPTDRGPDVMDGADIAVLVG